MYAVDKTNFVVDSVAGKRQPFLFCRVLHYDIHRQIDGFHLILFTCAYGINIIVRLTD